MSIITLDPKKVHDVRLKDIPYKKYFRKQDIPLIKDCSVALRKLPRLEKIPAGEEAASKGAQITGYHTVRNKRIDDLPIYLNGEVMRTHLFGDKTVRDTYKQIDLYLKGSYDSAFRWYTALRELDNFTQIKTENAPMINPFTIESVLSHDLESHSHMDHFGSRPSMQEGPETVEAVFVYDFQRSDILSTLGRLVNRVPKHSPLYVHVTCDKVN